ncbi:MAG: DUF6599 family protein [bacterium]
MGLLRQKTVRNDRIKNVLPKRQRLDCQYYIVVLVILATGPVPAKTLPEQMAGWTLTETKIYPGQSLYDYIDGGAEVYFEYGFSTVELGYYRKGEREILVEVYRMSSPQAAAGVYSFFRNYAASSLPKPYTGKLYEFYLECLNGSEYIKLVNYDSLSAGEQFALLRNLVPKPAPAPKLDLFDLLPEERLPDSEVHFNGPIALKNFCPLGRQNHFGVGERARASGCLIEIDGEQYRWVTLSGDSAQLAQDRERFLTFQGKNDYAVRRQPGYDLLEDQLSGKRAVMINRGDRIHFVFGIGKEAKMKVFDFIRTIE